MQSPNQHPHLILPSMPARPLPRSGKPVSPVAEGLVMDIPSVLRKYSLLAVIFTILGAAAGFVAVAVFSPVYRARARLEVQPITGSVLKLGSVENDGNEVDLQTEAQIILSSTFLRKVIERLQFDTLPPSPVQTDIFSKMRHYLKPNENTSLVNVPIEGLDTERVSAPIGMAIRTLEAHRIEGTRILEITCESTNPSFAADFLNTAANEYIGQNQQNRLNTVNLTTQWLSQELDQSRNKMLEAEKRLQEFVETSGNLFASRDSTLAETELRDFQDRLSDAETALIEKQTRYEAVKKAPADTLPEILTDETVHGIQTHIADLRREEAPLLSKLTLQHPKVKAIESQITELQGDLKKATDSAVARITSEYESAKRNRDLLSNAYVKQSQKVTAQGGKEAQYNALKREGESARQTYNNLLLQSSQAGIVGSIPVNNVWLVDPSVPPSKPTKPKPPLIIGIGAGLGLALCAGIVFLREGLNQRVSSPTHARQMFNIPQLGVIPSVEAAEPRRTLLPGLGLKNGAEDEAADGARFPPFVGVETGSSPQVSWLAESFRVTLASLVRESQGVGPPQVILVTSARPKEGKTTIACNLGKALAETGRRVLVLDADFRRPRVHKVFGLPSGRGLVDLLSEDTAIDEYPDEALSVGTSTPRLHILPNGRRSENISKALYSPRLRDLFRRLRKRFDTILVDAPPMLGIADARVMSVMVDGVVLVLRAGITDKNSAQEALEQIQSDNTMILGTVLNDWKGSSKSDMSYYYTLDTD